MGLLPTHITFFPIEKPRTLVHAPMRTLACWISVPHLLWAPRLCPGGQCPCPPPKQGPGSSVCQGCIPRGQVRTGESPAPDRGSCDFGQVSTPSSDSHPTSLGVSTVSALQQKYFSCCLRSESCHPLWLLPLILSPGATKSWAPSSL